MPTASARDLLVCHLAAWNQMSFHNSGDLKEPRGKLTEARLTAGPAKSVAWQKQP